MPSVAHRNIDLVTAALAAGGADPARVARMTVLPDAVTTAVAAAAALGVEVGQIANSLVFDADGTPLLVLTSGAHRVDVVKVAELVDGIDHIEQADADFVRTSTGFAIGGVAPVGHTTPVRTLVDVSLSRYPHVWAAAGHSHTVYRTSYEELLRVTAGQAIEVA